MSWKDILKDDEEKMAGAVTTTSSPAMFNISYSKKKKKKKDDLLKNEKKKGDKDKKKKDEIDINGNPVDAPNYSFPSKYQQWKTNCTNITDSDLETENVGNLYKFLKMHLKTEDIIRDGSRNKGRSGQGAIEFLDKIDEIMEENRFLTKAEAKLISQFADELEKYRNTGKDVGGNTEAFDPAFILFTDKIKDPDTGEVIEEIPVQGHYKTDNYMGGEGKGVDPSWLAGENPPHLALFSKKDTKFSKPKGLIEIMREAEEELEVDKPVGIRLDKIPPKTPASELNKIESVREYFDKVITNESLWDSDGKLLTNKLRRGLNATDLTLGNRDQNLVRTLAGMETGEDGLLVFFATMRLTSTATPVIDLVDLALNRKFGNKDKEAPNGKPAWQNTRRGGFDYREKGEEAVVFNVSSVRVARELAKIPQIRRFAQGLLKKISLFDEEDFRTSQAGKLLADKKFDLSPSQKKKVLQMFDKEDTNPKTIQFKLTKGAMKALLNQSVISRTRDLQTMNAPNTDKKIVLKSMWQQVLWRN